MISSVSGGLQPTQQAIQLVGNASIFNFSDQNPSDQNTVSRKAGIGE